MIQLPNINDRAVQNALNIVKDYLQRVPRSQIVKISANSTADTPFNVPHALGAVPSYANALPSSDASIYATPDDLREWSSTQIRLRCSVANAALLVKVEA